MQRTGVPGLHLLTPRERDCLRLLLAGLLTSQVAANLGISISTLNKHLASSRQKLGVARTAHALLLYQDRDRSDGAAETAPQNVQNGDYTSLVGNFARSLGACSTLDETWSVLHAYVCHLGITDMTCGLCAEPPGQLTNGARVVAMTFPEELRHLYREMGEEFDPTVPYAVHHTEGALLDNERLMLAVRGQLPAPAATFGEALLDHRKRYSLHQPGRDNPTNAPLVNVFSIEPGRAEDFARNAGRVRDVLQTMSCTFWDTVQRKRMLSQLAGLTRRQVEALTFAARGFTIPETADHMGVSQRSVEKILASARKRLGARTTPAAVYRATVFRALS